MRYQQSTYSTSSVARSSTGRTTNNLTTMTTSSWNPSNALAILLSVVIILLAFALMTEPRTEHGYLPINGLVGEDMHVIDSAPNYASHAMYFHIAISDSGVFFTDSIPADGMMVMRPGGLPSYISAGKYRIRIYRVPDSLALQSGGAQFTSYYHLDSVIFPQSKTHNRP